MTANVRAGTEGKAPLFESIEFTRGQAFKRFACSAPILTSLIACLLTFFWGLIKVSFSVGGGEEAGQPQSAWFEEGLWFFTASWLFCSVCIIPLTLFKCLSSRSREVWITGTKINARVGGFENSSELAECYWVRLGSVASDAFGFYIGNHRPRLKVQNRKQVFSLGYTEDAAIQWGEFLQDAGVPEMQRIPYLHYVLLFAPTLWFGGVMGYSIEWFLARVGWLPANPGMLIFTGAFDAAVLLLIYTGARYRPLQVTRFSFVGLLTLWFGCFPFLWNGQDLWLCSGNALLGALGALILSLGCRR